MSLLRTEQAGSGLRAALLLGLGLLPHQALLHMLMPADLGGKNLWLGVPLLLVVVSMLAAVLRCGTVAHYRWLAGAGLLWVVGCLAAMHWPQAGLAEVLVNNRPLFMLPLALLAGVALSDDPRFVRALWAMVLAQGVLQAVTGLLHIYAVPQIVTGTYAYWRGVPWFVTDEWTLFTSRESGTLGNPSAYAEMIGLSGFAACWLLAHRRLLLLATWFLFFAAVIPSLSRVVVVLLSVPYLLVLLSRLREGSLHVSTRLLLVVGLLLGALLVLVLVRYPQLLERFRTEGMYVRDQKNALLLNVLTTDPAAWVFGIPNRLLLDLRTPDGLSFGDNSFLRLAAASGVPVVLAWLYTAARLLTMGPLRTPSAHMLHGALLAFVLAPLTLGDVLFNDGWVLMASLMLVVRPPSAPVPDGVGRIADAAAINKKESPQ